MRDYFTILGIV